MLRLGNRSLSFGLSRGLACCICAGCFVLSACKPPTFVETVQPTWASIEIRNNVRYDDAWKAVVDLLVKRFDLEILEKDDGYIRTSWLYTWTGKMSEKYRVRVTVKFQKPDGVVEAKSEAHYGGQGDWIMGTDTLLLSTMKTDIMGKIGRTTR